MQSSFAPSVTPRPVKAGNATTPGKPLGSPASPRAGRTYTLSVSPLKTQARAAASGSSHPFSFGDPGTGNDSSILRQPEATTATSSATSSPSKTQLGLRKKQLILSGDIRNLDSNFDIAMSTARTVSLPHVIAAFARYGLTVSKDDAKTLLYEYEETNDTDLPYDAFVDEVVQLVRQTALNKVGTHRSQLKKIRLTHHLEKLSTMHAHIVQELQTLLGEKLRVSWGTVRDTFRAADPEHRGHLAKHEFAKLCRQLQIPMSSTLLEGLVLHYDVRAEGVIDYNDFLAYFGADFQHNDSNSVSNSLTFDRGILAGKGPTYGIGAETSSSSTGSNRVNNTLYSPGVSSALGGKSQKPSAAGGSPLEATRAPAQAADPLYMEQLRIVLNEKIASRDADVRSAFRSLDQAGNGRVAASEFTRVLHTFSLVVSQEESDALMAHVNTNQDGMVDYNEFFATFGDDLKPSATAIKKRVQENSSLVFPGHKDVKGANKNRVALSSPGNELKEAFSRLSDEIWRAIYVELEMSDPRKTGLVASAELLRVLGKYLRDLPTKSFSALFRTCGSHVNQLMNYRTLVKSYRQSVMDAIEFFHQDVHAVTEKTYKKSPTESLVMVWSIRVQRAQLTPTEWHNLKESIWQRDTRRQGRILASEFKPLLQTHLMLTDDQVAFLCFFYEDTTLVSDHVLIRYGSFLTDYEDPGLEASSSALASTGTDAAKNGKRKPPRVEGKGRFRPLGGAANNSNSSGQNGNGLTDAAADAMEREQEERRLRDFFVANIRSLEALLATEDSEKKGFVTLERFYTLCKALNGGKWKETTGASAAFFSKYVAQNHLFYYRGFLLDFDQKAGLQLQSFVLQEGDDDDDEGGDEYGEEDACSMRLMDVYQARDALRHHLTSSRAKQKATYKLFQRMDPGKSGLLTYPELRRALERLEISMDDETSRELLFHFEDEDDAGNKVGRVKYLQFLHANGGRDPDKLDGMSELSSHCSYYSAISISPRPARMGFRHGGTSPRPLVSRDHVVAAHAVMNAIEKPRHGMLSSSNSNALNGAAAASTVERKIKSQLEAKGKTKWKELARAFQQLDSEHRRGSVTAGSFKKVLAEFGILLDQEEVVRLQLKYDVEQNGRIQYHEFLRHLTNSMSDLSGGTSASGGGDGGVGGEMVLPSLAGANGMASPRQQATRKAFSGGGSSTTSSSGGVPDSLRHGVKAKWKAIYASFKTLDKQNLGRVSTSHFRQLLEWYALPVTDDTFLTLLRHFDHEDDGCVDYNKFVRTCVG